MTEQRFIITENMMDSLYGSDNAKYDQHAKHLLANRKLLAEIAKRWSLNSRMPASMTLRKNILKERRLWEASL